jgi:4-hydroxybenzoate polyprenyltransferase
MAKPQSLQSPVILVASHLEAMRPRQWTKNFIIFAAPLFAFSLSLKSLQDSVIAFFLFCFISSSFYLLMNPIALIPLNVIVQLLRVKSVFIPQLLWRLRCCRSV